MKKNIYVLDKVDCAACSIKIENALNSLDGVTSCSMNFLFLKLFVTFDEEKISDEIIEEKIHKSLYGVRIKEKNHMPFEDNYVYEKSFKRILFKRQKDK